MAWDWDENELEKYFFSPNDPIRKEPRMFGEPFLRKIRTQNSEFIEDFLPFFNKETKHKIEKGNQITFVYDTDCNPEKVISELDLSFESCQKWTIEAIDFSNRLYRFITNHELFKSVNTMLKSLFNINFPKNNEELAELTKYQYEYVLSIIQLFEIIDYYKDDDFIAILEDVEMNKSQQMQLEYIEILCQLVKLYPNVHFIIPIISSDIMLLRCRTNIVKEVIPVNSLQYIQMSSIKQPDELHIINVDEMGEVNNWISNAFSEAADEVMVLRMAQFAKNK